VTFWKDATGKTAEELEKLWHAEMAPNFRM